MKEEIRLAIATAALQGLLAHGFDKGEANYSLLPPDEAASLAFEYADALLEAARPRAPQAAGRLAVATSAAARDAEADRERPSTAPAQGHLPPVSPPAASAPSRGEVAPRPPEPPPGCEAPDCTDEGKLRRVEGLVDGVKRDVPILLCDLHFVGIPNSILLEWHRAYRKRNRREVVPHVDEKELARAG